MERPRLDPGARSVRWISNLTLSDEFRGQPFTLREWQAQIPRKIFGTIRPDGLRQYRRAFLFIPRKQAKTQLSAAIATFNLLGDLDAEGNPKQGQEIVCAASDRHQAGHLFKKAAEMVEADKFLRKQVRVYYSEKRIEVRKTGNVLKVVSSDGRRQFGLNPSTILIDELFTQPNSELYDALTSAQATRKEPLVILISTAGNRRDSLCYIEYERACKIRDGILSDPEYLAIIYEAPKDADWTDEKVWHQSQPALGDFAQLEFLRSEFKKAQESQSEESKFRTWYLNQWVASAEKWLRRDWWDACGKFDVKASELEGRECWGGLDLSSTQDITAFVLVFPMDDGTYKVICRFWIPRLFAEECDRKGRGHYLQWGKAGWITLTDGPTIDYRLIEEEIVGKPAKDDEPAVPGLMDKYQIQRVLIDKHNAMQTTMRLLEAGIEAEFFRQGTISMNDPTKFLEVLISREQLHHGNNPVLTFMAENAVSEKDSQGNVKLSKDHSLDKIDGMIGLVQAVAGAMTRPPESTGPKIVSFR